MNRTVSLALIFFISLTLSLTAQEAIEKNAELSGLITDYDNKPIKGVRIFVDSVKTKVKTDKAGLYNISLSPKSKLITAFSVKHGLIDIDYTGQNKINFVFPKDSPLLTKKQFAELGYGSSNGSVDYSGYPDIFQLFRAKFPNTEVVGQDVFIKGTGARLTGTGGRYKPLYIVNGSMVNNIANIAPVNIKSISVERTKSSLYGARGAGGVIKIKLK